MVAIKLNEIYNGFSKILPTAYLHFKTPQPLPFMVYGLKRKNYTHADNTVHFNTGNAWLEVYTEEPNIKLIKQTEKFFIKNEIPFEYQGEEYLKSEKMYISVFNFIYEE